MDATSSELITVEDVRQICFNYFEQYRNENIVVISYEFSQISEAPQGYLGTHKFLNVLIKRKSENCSDDIEEKVRLFVKSTPTEVLSHMKYVEEFGVFQKEINVYRNVIPRLLEYVTSDDEYFAPKCYLAKSNLLVFENLTERGFCMGTKEAGILDYEHLKCVLKSLACLHGASIVLEKNLSQTLLEVYAEILEENSYPSDPLNIRSIVFKKATNALCVLIKEIPKYRNSSELTKILERFPDIMKKIFEFCNPSSKWKNVFNHGDLWANNVMFKYKLLNTKYVPVKCKLVDFQLARYAPPIFDVITVLTIPTTSAFRERHLTTLLESYFKFLKDFVAKHNIDLEEVIPKSEFDESVEYFKLAGLIESCLFSHLTLLPSELTTGLVQDSENFDEFLLKQRPEVCRKAFLSDKVYRSRMTDMISAIVDEYILCN